MNNPVVLDDNLQAVPAVVVALQNNMIKALRKEYPAWAETWHISVDTDQGIVIIRNTLIGGKMGFYMKIADIDPEMRKVRRFAGQLFERYNIARKKGHDLRQVYHDIKRDGARRPIHET